MKPTRVSIAVMVVAWVALTPFLLNAQTSVGTDPIYQGRLKNTDGPVAVNDGAEVGRRGEDCNNNGIPDDAELSGAEWAEIMASDAAMSDYFGNSVSLSGDVAVIGAYGNDDGGTSAGSAYVYRFDGSTWVELATLAASDAAAGDLFGISVSISGDVVVIGARDNDDAGTDSGSAYIFHEPGGGWMDMTETAKLTASDAVEYDRFGVSVSVSGDVVVIGARDDDDGGDNSGSVYVFERPTDGWTDMTETAKLTASDADAGDSFGSSLSLDGDVVLIGAYGNDDGGSSSGSAYVFREPAGGWVDMTETAKLTASSPTAGDSFGGAVSVSGTVVVIGAVGDDDAATDAGAAYIFHMPAGGWVDMTQTTKILAADAAYHDIFGGAVSVSGNRAVIGAIWDEDAGYDSGSAYLFGRNTDGIDQWGQITKLAASDCTAYDTFGYAVSVRDGLAVIGANGHDHAAADAGAAYVFAVGSTDCNANDIPDDCDIDAGTSPDCNGSGIPDECESDVLCVCDGDANGDGIVDPLDSGFVLARFGCPVGTGDPSCDIADMNGDGLVDPLDVGFVLARFGTCL